MRAIAYTVLLGLVILPNSVFAENAVQNNNDNQQTTTDSTIVTTQPIVIEGQQQVPASSTSLNVEEAKEQIQKIPGGVAIKDAEDYKNSRATTLKDILDYTPGVLIQSRINEEASLSIRGSGLSRTFHLRGVNLYQDHVPINLADGFADFQDIDPLAYEYTEVYKGANALKFGSSTLGGAVNFVTPTGYNSDMITVRLEGGSFGTVREQITSGGVYGNADYYVSLSNIMSNGYRDFSDQNNTRFSSNFGYKFNPKLETRFYINLADINQELPGNLTKTQLEDDPKQANANNKNNNYQRDFQTMRLSNKTTWHGEGYDISGGIYTVQKELFHPIFQVIDQESSNYGIFADSTIYGRIANMANEFTLGVNLSTGTTDAKRFLNINGGNYGAKTADGEQDSSTAIIFAENALSLTNDFTLIAGLQYLTTKREFDDRFLADGNQTDDKNFDGLSPKIGAIYQITPEVQIFGNVSGAYEPPTFGEIQQNSVNPLGFADVDAQKMITFELGTRGKYAGLNFDASIYHTRLRDELMMYTQVNNGQTGVVNADKTYHQGIELGLGAKVFEDIFQQSDNVGFKTAYTYSNFRFEDDPVYGGNNIPGAPDHYLRAEIRYNNPLGFYVAPHIEAVPEGYYVDMANTLKTDPYMILGLRAGADVTEHAEFFIDARNLTDQNYAATTGIITTPNAFNTALFVPGEGPSVFGGLTVKW